MWPTSIAVSNRSAPPHCGQVSPSADSRRSAKRGWKSRPASTPRRCQPSRFAPATNCPSRSVSSAITSPLKPTGPSEPPEAPNAARISSSVAGRDGRPRAASSFAGSMRSSPRTSASTTVPSSVVTGIAFEVAATSIARNSARASQVFTPGVSTSSVETSVSGKIGARGTPARHLDVGGEIAVLAGDERVLAGAAGARKSAEPLPPIIPDSASTSNTFSSRRAKMRW